MKKIGIIGLGWLGLPLAKHWQTRGEIVKGTCNSNEKAALLSSQGINTCKLHFPEDELPLQWFDDIWTLIIAVPPSKIGEAYLSSLKKLRESISQSHISKVFFVSSIGVFEDDCTVVNEKSTPTLKTEKSKLLFNAEQIFFSLQACIVRLAGLYGEDRHPGKWFAGKKNITNGLAPVNLISLNECIQLFDQLLYAEKCPTIVHGVSAFHPSRMNFYRQKTQELGLELPEFILEKDKWKVVESVYNLI